MRPHTLQLLCLLLTVGSIRADAPPDAAGPAAPIDVLAAMAAVGPWTRQAPPQAYGQDDLWEYIDGAASLFVSYHFATMATATYKAEGVRGTLTVDLYLLPDDLHAYGLYARERAPDVALADLGTQGYVTGAACRFVKGRYYAKLSLAPPPKEPAEHLLLVAHDMAGRLTGSDDLPAVLSVFPSHRQIPNTAVFVAADLLGQSALGSGFLVDYDLGLEDPSRVFLHLDATEEGARQAFDRFREFAARRATDLQPLPGLGDEAFTCDQPYYGPTVVVREGKAMGGLARSPSITQGRQLLERILARLAAYERSLLHRNP